MVPPVSHFFNSLAFHLNVECDEEEYDRVRDSGTGVEGSEVEAHASIDFQNVRCCDEGADELRLLYEEEWKSVAYHAPSITLASDKCPAKTFTAPNGRNFTVMELLRVVEEWEQLDRCRAGLDGVVDVSGTWFEGLHEREDEDSVWEIHWGS